MQAITRAKVLLSEYSENGSESKWYCYIPGFGIFTSSGIEVLERLVTFADIVEQAKQLADWIVTVHADTAGKPKVLELLENLIVVDAVKNSSNFYDLLDFYGNQWLGTSGVEVILSCFSQGLGYQRNIAMFQPNINGMTSIQNYKTWGQKYIKTFKSSQTVLILLVTLIRGNHFILQAIDLTGGVIYIGDSQAKLLDKVIPADSINQEYSVQNFLTWLHYHNVITKAPKTFIYANLVGYPMQNDSSSCGVFALMACLELSKYNQPTLANLEIKNGNKNSEDLQKIRLRLVECLLNKMHGIYNDRGYDKWFWIDCSPISESLNIAEATSQLDNLVYFRGSKQGLTNRGNLCYIIATIQLIVPVIEYLESYLQLPFVALPKLLKLNSHTSILDAEFDKFLQEIYKLGNFPQGQQCDASELLYSIMKPDSGHITVTNAIVCIQCNSTIQHQNEANVITLSVDNSGNLPNISQCVWQTGSLMKTCSKCSADNSVKASSETAVVLTESTRFALFHINRTSIDKVEQRPCKLKQSFDCPVVITTSDNVSLHLMAMVIHLGDSLDQGHYITYRRESWHDQSDFLELNDSMTKIVKFDQVPFEDAYILLYVAKTIGLDDADFAGIGTGCRSEILDNASDNDTDGDNSEDDLGEAEGDDCSDNEDKTYRGKNIKTAQSLSNIEDYVCPIIRNVETPFSNESARPGITLKEFLEYFIEDETGKIISCQNWEAVTTGNFGVRQKVALNLVEFMGYEPDELYSRYDVDSILLTCKQLPTINGSISYFLYGKHQAKLLKHNHIYEYFPELNKRVKLFRIPHLQLFQIADSVSVLIFFPKLYTRSKAHNAIGDKRITHFMVKCFLPGIFKSINF